MSLPLEVMVLKKEDNSVLEVSFNSDIDDEVGAVYLMEKETTLC